MICQNRQTFSLPNFSAIWYINLSQHNNYHDSHHQCELGHERMLTFNIRTFFSFQFRMFECLFTLLTPTQWVFNSLINLCGDNFMVKPQIRYLPLLTYSNKVIFCIKFVNK